jgi:membrane protein
MSLENAWDLGKKSVFSWMDDYASSMGAALAYYTLFSLAPLLVIAIGVAGLVFGDEAARGQIFGQLDGLVGHDGAIAIQGLLKSVNHPAKSVVASILGTGTLMLGAMSVFNELQSDLDRIWRAPAAQKQTGIWSLLRSRLLTFGMILAIGFLLLVSLVLSAGIAALGKWWGPYFGGWEVVLQVFNFIVSFGIVTVLFAMMYKILPRVKVAWRDVWIGAAVTSLLFTVGKFAIGLYLGKSGVTSGFGAAASIVVLLVWVYYSAQIFLLGAEFTWVYAHSHGSRVNEAEQPAAVPVRGDSAPARPTAQPASAGAHATSATSARAASARPPTAISVSWWIGVAIAAVATKLKRRRAT